MLATPAEWLFTLSSLWAHKFVAHVAHKVNLMTRQQDTSQLLAI